MTRLSAFALWSTLVLCLIGHVSATHYCGGIGEPIVLGFEGSIVGYARIDSAAEGNYAWVWLEDNGMPGLQRGGSALLGGLVDPCQDSLQPDTALFGYWLPFS